MHFFSNCHLAANWKKKIQSKPEISQNEHFFNCQPYACNGWVISILISLSRTWQPFHFSHFFVLFLVFQFVTLNTHYFPIFCFFRATRHNLPQLATGSLPPCNWPKYRPNPAQLLARNGNLARMPVIFKANYLQHNLVKMVRIKVKLFKTLLF